MREERRLWRKIDWHIMPIVTVMYLCSFVDRSNIGACARGAACGRVADEDAVD